MSLPKVCFLHVTSVSQSSLIRILYVYRFSTFLNSFSLTFLLSLSTFAIHYVSPSLDLSFHFSSPSRCCCVFTIPPSPQPAIIPLCQGVACSLGILHSLLPLLLTSHPSAVVKSSCVCVGFAFLTKQYNN